MKPREVSFKSKFETFKHKPALAIIGIVLLGIGLLSVIPILIIGDVLTNLEPKVDYEDVYENGTVTEGVIVEISTNTSVTINNQNPIVITFEYDVEGRMRRSETETLDANLAFNYRVGDRVEVRYKGKDAIIVGIKSYGLPGFVKSMLQTIYYMPWVLIAGAFILFFIAWLYARKVISLYKYGRVEEAELISSAPKSGSHKFLKVFYKFETKDGRQQLGECITFKSPALTDKQKSDKVKVFVSENDTNSCVVPEIESYRNNWGIEV